jgi:hypothetical protein
MGSPNQPRVSSWNGRRNSRAVRRASFPGYPALSRRVRICAPEVGRTPHSGLRYRCGEVSEWLKEHAWKVCKRLNRASGVRIPLSPPLFPSFASPRDAAVFLWWPRRPLATLGRKPRQGRKAATVSIDAGAEVSRRGHRHFDAPHRNPKIFAGKNLGPRLCASTPLPPSGAPPDSGGWLRRKDFVVAAFKILSFRCRWVCARVFGCLRRINR